MNKIILVGNLTRDIELRYSQSGSAIASFGLAVNRTWRDQSGEKKQEVMFIDVSVFGKSAEIANQYLSKGKKVLIEGRLKLEQWQDKNGGNRSKHAVVCENFEFLDTKDGKSSQNMGTGSDFGGNQQNYGQQNQSFGGQDNFVGRQQSGNQNQGGSGGHSHAEIPIDDDDIPF